MKKWLFVCFSVLAIVACSKDDSKSPQQTNPYGTNNGGATTPLDNCAMNGGIGCNNQYQNQYGQYGNFYPNGYRYPTYGNGMYYGYQGQGYGYQNLACPPGTQPVMNGSAGLGCIPLHSYQNLQYQGYQMQYQQIPVGGNYQNVATSCQMDQHCGGGYYCQRTLGQQVGICARR